ncbi:cupin domain-containing protein [Nonomuraea sp. NPDC052265]|uniref:cupin domain-containing protein n=1 Tax=Nonomuraea sp. NPDC052265 TaxID=3364374 RepID=UPI0037C6545D
MNLEERLYAGFAGEHLIPLWTQVRNLMPVHPKSGARPHVWGWKTLHTPTERTGELIPVGRGGERRVIAPVDPRLDGLPYATPTLWAAIQYLGPREVAPEHRRAQHAFRFGEEGKGVWTVVDGDPGAMRRGDFLLTSGRHFHGRRSTTGIPMGWIDGRDIPFVRHIDTVLRVRSGAGGRRLDAGRVAVRAVVGAFRLRPVVALGARPSSPIADRRLPLGAYRPGPGRAARAGGRGPFGRGRVGARGHPVQRSDDRWGCHSDDQGRVLPAAGRGGDRCT